MGWTEPEALDAHVRRLDNEGLASFVTDLWTARGFETDRDGRRVIARRGDETRVLYILTRHTAPSGETARNVDFIVAPGRPKAGETLAAELDARFLDAADLGEMLRYALKRDVAADLCQRHFGAAPDELTYPPRERLRRAVERLEARTVAAVTVAVILVAAGAVFGLVGPDVSSGTTDETVRSSGTPTDAGSSETASSMADDGSTSTAAGVTGLSAVPGVNETGLSNVTRLAQAHATVVSEAASYTIWFDYYAPENGSSGQVQYDTDVRVQGDRASVRTSRERSGGNRSLRKTVYFDGTDRYVATNSSGEFTRVDDRLPRATPLAVPFTRPTVMVQTYLATPENSVRLAETDARGKRYRLHGTGRPAALPNTVADYEMMAIVDERGFVWAFEAEFTVRRDSDDDGVSGRERVRLTWTYDRINNTAIQRNP